MQAVRTKPRCIHLAREEPAPSLWIAPFLDALSENWEVEIHRRCAAWPLDRLLATCRAADVLLTGWGSQRLPAELATDPGRLRFICHLTGTLRESVPIELIQAGIPVTNWGDTPARPVAEGALTLLLACLHNLRPHIETKRAGGWWEHGWRQTSGSMEGLRLGIYGFGPIGRHFAGLCLPLGAVISVFDPYCAHVPPEMRRAESLDDLFSTNDAVSAHAGLSHETRGSVTARHLAMLPDGGIVINTARGAVFDEGALFAELASGRLRAGLDVLTTDEEQLPPDHPARFWPNVILTAHKVSERRWPPAAVAGLLPLHRVALENLRRHLAGEPLRFRVDEARYEIST